MIKGSHKAHNDYIVLITMCGLLTLMWCFPLPASAQNNFSRTIKRTYDPIEILGENLRTLLGVPLDHMLLYSARQGRFQPIHHQFDERLINGRFVFPEGPAGNPKDANNVLDVEDMLVFMISDCGDRVEKKYFPEKWHKTIEIELIDPLDQSRGWAYLFSFSQKVARPNLPPKVYLDPNPAAFIGHGRSWMFEGITNKVRGKTYRTVFNKKYYTSKEAGGSGENILDRMKTRVQTSLLMGKLVFGFNESNCSGGMFAYKIGPVRGFGSNWIQVNFASGLMGPKFWLDTYLYDYMVSIPTSIKVFFNPGYVITAFQLSFGYDLNESAAGMKFYNSHNLKGFTIDGKMSEEEKTFNPAMDLWRLFTGPQGTLIYSTYWDPRLVKQAEISTYYNDDAATKEPPEDITGNFGTNYCRAVIKNVQPGEYQIQVSWFLPPNFYDPRRLKIEVIKEYLNIRDNPVEISINGEASFPNPGGFPSPLH